MKHGLIIILSFLSMNCLPQPAAPANQPLQLSLNQPGKTSLTRYLNEKKWNELFPNRHGRNVRNSKKAASDFYSFSAFVTAAGLFPEFLSGNAITQKRELAAFLANIAQETSGGWAEAPGGYFVWGLYFVEEKQDSVKNTYTDFS
ncbi:MAG TPA: chitinase, partial [Paludibacter sp.]|nr:chitinase [Paludibacter sp.]